jgi:hypothetical protein
MYHHSWMQLVDHDSDSDSSSNDEIALTMPHTIYQRDEIEMDDWRWEDIAYDTLLEEDDDEIFFLNQIHRYNQALMLLSPTTHRERRRPASLYVLGTCYTGHDGVGGRTWAWTLCTQIHIFLFYLYPYPTLMAYDRLVRVSPTTNRIEIMQEIDPTRSQVVLKTVWLRLVQRTWRRVYRERQRVLAVRKSWMCHIHFVVRGRYPPGTAHIPELRGMLAITTHPIPCSI